MLDDSLSEKVTAVNIPFALDLVYQTESIKSNFKSSVNLTDDFFLSLEKRIVALSNTSSIEVFSSELEHLS